MTSLTTRTAHPMVIDGEFRDASDGATISVVAATRTSTNSCPPRSSRTA